MTAARRVGAYAKLLANYASDDAIIEAGEAAELLFCRGLAFCSTSDSDGYITDAQVVRYVGAGMRDAMKRADRLAVVGVWQRVDGGYIVRSWLKIHDSSEAKGRRRKADRERKTGAIQKDSERNPDGIQTEGVSESLSLIHDSAQHGTTRQVEKSLEGDRHVTLREADATDPPCTEHGTSNSDAKCHGCKRYRESVTRRLKAQSAELRVIGDACMACDPDYWLLNDDGSPSAIVCDHKLFAARRAAS